MTMLDAGAARLARSPGRDWDGVQFRTISTTRGGGWVLRPVPGAHIMRDVEERLKTDVPAVIEKMLAAVHLPGTTAGTTP